ncbi:MAG TPA: PAS domain-containing protein, partial [Streptomyces sp.]|nr:PAS domain-containing protein [Streptomyces sp.]
MDETSLRTLLEHLPVSWWEADGQLRVTDSGGGAFSDARTAQRFFDVMREEFAAARCTPEAGHRQVRFDERLFEVTWPVGDTACRDQARGVAVEVAPATAMRRNAALADLSPAATFIRDLEGRYLWTNHAYAHLYGTTPGNIIGKYLKDFDPPEDAAQFLALDREIVSQG